MRASYAGPDTGVPMTLVAIAFVPVWIAFRYRPGNWWGQVVSGFWQSAGALTTSGVATDPPLWPGEKLFAIFETFVGIYFLGIIVAGYVSWMKEAR